MSIANEITRIQNAKSRLISILSEHVSLTGNESINELVELAKEIGIEGVTDENNVLTLDGYNGNVIDVVQTTGTKTIRVKADNANIGISGKATVTAANGATLTVNDASTNNTITAKNLEPDNIKEGVDILGMVGTYKGGSGTNTSDATATASDILLGKTAYGVDGKIEGTIETYDYSVSEGGSSGHEQEDNLVTRSFTLESYINNRITSVGEYGLASLVKLKNVILSNVTQIGSYGFYQCIALESVEMPNLKNINVYGFDNCSSLKSIDLSNVTQIGMYAFNKCSALESVYAPKITKVDTGVFYYCSALVSANLPNVTSIGASAFRNCKALTDIYIGYDGLVSLGHTSVFKDVTAGVKIHVKSAYADQYATATNWSSLIADGTIVIVGDYTDE